MFDEDSNKNQAPICNFVPGYRFYNNVGYGLAEVLVNLFERIINLYRWSVFGRR